MDLLSREKKNRLIRIERDMWCCNKNGKKIENPLQTKNKRGKLQKKSWVSIM